MKFSNCQSQHIVYARDPFVSHENECSRVLNLLFDVTRCSRRQTALYADSETHITRPFYFDVDDANTHSHHAEKGPAFARSLKGIFMHFKVNVMQQMGTN